MSAYLIVDISIHDQQQYLEYVKRVPPLVDKHGGDYLIRDGNPITLEGNWQPERLVVLRFPCNQSARAFLDDPDYAPVKSIRHQAASTNLVLVEGI